MSIDERTAPLVAQAGAAQGDKRRWWILVVVASVQFMVGLDATVVNVMLPQLQRGIGLSIANTQWVMSIYVLLFGGLMLMGGRLADVVGRRRVLLAGMALFIFGSVLAGTAHGTEQLLIARALQGLGAAGLAPAALSIMVTSFPDPQERAKAFGIWGTVIGIGASIGTLLGGAIIDVGWRWAFYINIPIGVVLAIAAVMLIPGRTARTGPRQRADLAGALTSTAGLLLLVYGITAIGSRGWSDAVTLASLVGGAALLVVFVLVEQRSSAPLVPLRLFRGRGLVVAALGQILAAGVMLPCFFLLPQFMQTVLGYSPLQTGLAYIPTSLAMMIVAPAASKMVAKTGPRALYLAGTVALGATLALMLGAKVHAGYWSLLLPVTALLGIGLVLCLITASMVGTSQATESDAGVVSALLNSSSEIGGALGLTVAATVLQTRTASLVAHGMDPVAAFTQGLHRGFGALFIWIALGALVGVFGFRGLKATGESTEVVSSLPADADAAVAAASAVQG
ncbi:DHA2 family efflux MFS transporter permease subunit [Streptacidiphilus rugosus]|uniref:DHA2 family efflux MFS transporter permease subunit n=1 Tax=Streptacidiphilus rugosus TaxID=405783 RepID=UPI00068F9142|nr:DHA2 family efflux MFS transporter permease subunit [Streptacidiphilus rugosus]